MTNIYTVSFQDNYKDEHSDSIVAIWSDKQTAFDYAAHYHLEHEETVTVEERQEGVQHFFKVQTIYERQHYDHTYALFSSMVFYSHDNNLSYDAVLLYAIQEFSPLLTQDVDFDRLYALYKEQFCYDEED